MIDEARCIDSRRPCIQRRRGTVDRSSWLDHHPPVEQGLQQNGYINSVPGPLELPGISSTSIFFCSHPQGLFFPLLFSILWPKSLCSTWNRHHSTQHTYKTLFFSTKKTTLHWTMCSLYVNYYACGCALATPEPVYCAARGTPDCKGVREKTRQQNCNCPNHS